LFISKRFKSCPAEKREKDIKWQRTNVKNVCARIDIKRNSNFSIVRENHHVLLKSDARDGFSSWQLGLHLNDFTMQAFYSN
jgi:hypothetical protein